MKKISRFIVLIVLALFVGAAVFLATWQIPAPRVTIEKVIPDDRFPR